jgi:iron complex outermembrane receptor protein
VSFRWQPVSQVLFRGSAGRGFRAPSLADLYSPLTQGVSQTGLTDPTRCPTTDDGIKDCATQFGTTNGGNSHLKPEKSTNYTLGIVLEPTRDISIALDAFKIKLTDTISQGLPQAFILANLDKYGSFVTRGPVDPAFPNLPGPIVAIDQTNINLGETRLHGVDIDMRWRIPTPDYGRFTVSFSGTYFGRYDTQNPDGTFSPQVGNLNNATSGGVIPRWKTYQAVNWAYGPLDMTFALNWQSSYTDVPGSLMDTPVFRRVGAYEIYDLQGTYAFTKNLRFTLGVKNLFDRDPPYTNQGFSFQSGYDPQYADPRGRFVYARVNYQFQ